MKYFFHKILGSSLKSIFLNTILYLILFAWIGYLGILWFGSTQFNSTFERSSYRELYTATLESNDKDYDSLPGNYICELEKSEKNYSINWIIIADKRYDVIMEDDFDDGYAVIDTDAGFFEITLIECQHSSSFVFSWKAAGLTVLSICVFIMIIRESRDR